MNSVDSNRLKIWQALSQFFWYTEVDQATYDQVAQSIVESGYTPPAQVHSILWNEVFPVLNGNLKSVAGEWKRWSDEWLLQHMVVQENAVAKPARGWTPSEIVRCWAEGLARIE